MTDVNIRSLGRNSFYAGIMQVWQIGSRFVITPIIITKLGLSGYGAWTLIFSICAYISMLDTSFGFAYAKFTAEYDQKGDYRKLSRILGSGIALVSGFGLIGLIVLWFFRGSILGVLNVPHDLMSDAKTALMIVGFCFLLRISFGSVYQVLAGLQRLDLQYKLTILSSMIEFIISLVLLTIGYGLLALAIGNFFGQLTGMVSGRILCYRLCPTLRISPLLVSREGLKEIISLGGRFQILQFMNTSLDQGLRMLISGICGISFLAIFELADKLIGLGNTLSGSIIAPLMPAFANIHAGNDKSKLESLYLQVSKIVSVTATVSLGFLFAFADQLITIWTGRDLPLSGWTIRVMIFSQFFVLLTGVGTASLRGKGTLRLELIYMIVSATLIVVLTIPAAIWGSYHHIIVTLVASQVAGAIWFLAAFSRSEELLFKNFWRHVVIRSALIGGSLTMAMMLVHPALTINIVSLPPRFSAVFDVMVWAPVFAILTTLFLWYATFSKSERQNLIHRLFFYRSSMSSASAVGSS